MNDLEWFDTKGMLNEYDKMRKETYINETNKIRNQLRYRIKSIQKKRFLKLDTDTYHEHFRLKTNTLVKVESKSTNKHRMHSNLRIFGKKYNVLYKQSNRKIGYKHRKSLDSDSMDMNDDNDSKMSELNGQHKNMDGFSDNDNDSKMDINDTIITDKNGDNNVNGNNNNINGTNDVNKINTENSYDGDILINTDNDDILFQCACRAYRWDNENNKLRGRGKNGDIIIARNKEWNKVKLLYLDRAHNKYRLRQWIDDANSFCTQNNDNPNQIEWIGTDYTIENQVMSNEKWILKFNENNINHVQDFQFHYNSYVNIA
mmetsp:Transcript_51952/g.63615  ORF Transcript_51952/g.63615 Transcript_51952/m.63615 type:complete len:316 (+) Transcript_51952:100-1047(+)